MKKSTKQPYIVMTDEWRNIIKNFICSETNLCELHCKKQEVRKAGY